jgi:hypothetical protein
MDTGTEGTTKTYLGIRILHLENLKLLYFAIANTSTVKIGKYKKKELKRILRSGKKKLKVISNEIKQ